MPVLLFQKRSANSWAEVIERHILGWLVLQVFSIEGVQNQGCAELKRTAYEVMRFHHEVVAINGVVLNYFVFMPQFTHKVLKTAIITT